MARILIVDDDPPIRRFISSVLRTAGHAVTEADDGLNAIELLRTETFDLMITDIVMPERDGLEMLMNLRRQKNTMPIIAMTGMPENSSLFLKVAKQLGASCTLTKPFTAQQLLDMVSGALTFNGRPHQ